MTKQEICNNLVELVKSTENIEIKTLLAQALLDIKKLDI